MLETARMFIHACIRACVRVCVRTYMQKSAPHTKKVHGCVQDETNRIVSPLGMALSSFFCSYKANVAAATGWHPTHLHTGEYFPTAALSST